MTIIEKIKQSVEGATGMPFLYHAAGELNELIARSAELPCAFAFLLDSGTIDDVNGRYHERVTIAVMFCDKTKFDFNALENEQIIDRMKVKAYKWMQSLRMSNALLVVSVNNTQRLYDNTTDILTGFAVNITLEDIAGVGECELPEVVIDVDKNGSYDVVGVDKVRVNVVPKLEELEVTENGEYLPPTDIAGFSKVVSNVLPKTTDLVATENDKEYIANDYGVDAFGIVKTELRNLVKITTFSLYNYDGADFGFELFDTSYCQGKLFEASFYNCPNIERIDFRGKVTNKVPRIYITFRLCPKLKWLDLTTVEFDKGINVGGDLSGGWDTNIPNLVGDLTYEEVKSNPDICVLKEYGGKELDSHGGAPKCDWRQCSLNHASLLALVRGLADRTSMQEGTLRFFTNIWEQLDDEEKAIATEKNWTIVLQ